MRRRKTSNLCLLGIFISGAILSLIVVIFEIMFHKIWGCGSDFALVFFVISFVVDTTAATYYIGRPEE